MKTNAILNKIIILNLVILALAPIYLNMAVLAQTSSVPVGPGMNGGQVTPTGTAAQTQPTDPNVPYYTPQTTLIQQAAEQQAYGTMSQNVNSLLVGNTNLDQYNETYLGLHTFFGNDIVGNLFTNIGQLFGKWLSELIDGWVAQAAQFLTAFLRTFVLNPNIAVNGLASTPGGPVVNDGISPYIREGANIMYGIAIDLLLLLFILCIWRYWVDAAWRGNNNLMGAVGRLIFTAGLLLAWPTLYAFEIQITNEMIKAIYFDSTSQVLMLDSAIASAIKGGLVAGGSLLVNAFAPVLGATLGGVAAGSVGGVLAGGIGEVISYAALVIYLVLGVALISELIYILVLKAIQTALLTAQYMFAPIFLVFMATPDTENIASGFMRSFVEVSLWTFVWVGLLKVLVIILFSGYNPWGQIVLCVGVLQIMIQVPSFMSRAQISPMSDYISAGMVTGGLVSMAQSMGKAARARTGQFFDWYTNQRFAAAQQPQSQTVDLNNLPNGISNPELLSNIRSWSRGNNPNKQGGDGGLGGMGDGKGVAFPLDANGNPIKPPSGLNPPTKPGDKNKKPDGGSDPSGKNIDPLNPNGNGPKKTDGSAGQTGNGINPTEAGNLKNPGAAGTNNQLGNNIPVPPTNTSKAGVDTNTVGKTDMGKANPDLNASGASVKTASNANAAGKTDAGKTNSDLNSANSGVKTNTGTSTNPLVTPPVKGDVAKNLNSTDGKENKDASAQANSNLTNANGKEINPVNGDPKAAATPDSKSGGTNLEAGKMTTANGQVSTDKSGQGNTDAGKIDPSKNPLLGPDGKPLGSLANGANNANGNLADASKAGIGNAAANVPPIKTSQTQKLNDDKGNAGSAKQDVESEMHTQLDQNGKPVILDSNLSQKGGQTSSTGNQGNNVQAGSTNLNGNLANNSVNAGNNLSTPTPPPINPNNLNTASLMGDLSKPVVGNGTTLPNAMAGLGNANATANANSGSTNTARQELDTQVFQLTGENGQPVTVETHLKPNVSQAGNPGQNPNVQANNVSMANSQPVPPVNNNQASNMPNALMTGLGLGALGAAASGLTNPQGNLQHPISGNIAGGQNIQGQSVSGQNLNPGASNHSIESNINIPLEQNNNSSVFDHTVRMQGNTVPGTNAQNNVAAGSTSFNNGGIISHAGNVSPSDRLNMANNPANNPILNGPSPVPGQRSFNANSNWTGTSRAIAGGLSDVSIANGNVDATTMPTFSQFNDAPSISDPVIKNNVNDENVRPAQMFTQPNYMHVLPRGLATDIRTAQGPTQETSPTGRPNIVGNGQGQVNHIRYGANATREQEALQMYVAGYAGALSTDSEAFDAARQSAIAAGEDGPQGALENAAAGFMAFNGGNFRQTALAKQRFNRSLFKHAVLGSEAYVSGQSGNAYTEYLRVRYGAMTPDKQAWSTHIMTDPESPESGWSADNAPATDTLLSNGLPISETNRAVAANKNVRKLPAWGRGTAIRGGANYVESIVSNMVGPNAHPMEKAAALGYVGTRISQPEVGACTAIYAESATPDQDTSNVDLVQEVARLGASPMYAGDYNKAYRNIRAMVGHMGGSSNGGSRNAGMSPMSGSPVNMPASGPSHGPAPTSGPANVSMAGGNLPPMPPVNNSSADQTVVINYGNEPVMNQDINPNLGNISGTFGQSLVNPGQVNYVARQVGGSSNFSTNRVSEVNVTSRQQASKPNITQSDIDHQVQKTGASLSSKIHSASQILMNLHNAGFNNNDLAHPQIAQTAYEVHNSDPSMLYSASIASRIMGPADFNPQTVQVVQQMVDAGWSGEQISRPDVITAQNILSNSGSRVAPSPRIVQTLRRDSRYQPSPNSFIPNDLLSEIDNQNNYGRNNFGNNNGRNNGRRNNF